jgi:hypothetical protein
MVMVLAFTEVMVFIHGLINGINEELVSMY